MTCKHNINNHCKISEKLCGIPVELDEGVCKACEESPYPQSINRVTASRACWKLRQEGHPVPKELQETALGYTKGPGTELKKIISFFPVPKKSGCSRCRSLETKMNKWGPSKCTKKMDYIVKKLMIAAKRRNIPTNERLVSILVKRAIKQSRNLE